MQEKKKKSFTDLLFGLFLSGFSFVLQDASKPLDSLQIHLKLLNKALLFVHFFHFAKFNDILCGFTYFY